MLDVTVGLGEGNVQYRKSNMHEGYKTRMDRLGKQDEHV